MKVTAANLCEFYPHATSSLSCWNTPRNLEGKASALFCWSVHLCQNMQPQKNVHIVEAQGHLMGSLKCQSIPGSVCGWLSMWQVFKKCLKTCHYCFKSAAQLGCNRTHQLLRRRARAALLSCPFWKRENFKRKKISYGLEPSEVTPFRRRQRTHIFHLK